MDYKEKYNKLVEAVKVLQEANPSDEGIQNWVNDNVPELAESEGERIKKEIIEIVMQPTWKTEKEFHRRKELCDWIEKQGQKSAWSEEDEYTLNETIQHLKLLIEIDKTKHCACDVQYYQRDIDWLKTIKQRIGE